MATTACTGGPGGSGSMGSPDATGGVPTGRAAALPTGRRRATRRALVLGSAATLTLALLLGSAASAAAQSGPLELTLENIYRGSASVSSADLSPDGIRLAVQVSGPEGAVIRLVDATGEAPERGEPWVEGRSPRWSPDGRRILFRRSGQIWTIGIGDRQPRQVTRDLEQVREPAWSPDGRRIAFMSTEGGDQDVWVVRADGSGTPRQLTEGAFPADDTRYGPAWSPDGSTIAYVSYKAGYYSDDVWLVDVDSGRERQLSHTLMARSRPVWSPDGSRIALVGTAKDEFWYHDLARLYVLEPATGAEAPVDMQVTAADTEPIWSADSRLLYFARLVEGDHDLWVVHAGGGLATQVTSLGGAMGSFSASFTADDGVERFAFVRNTLDSPSEVWVAPAAGGHAERRTRLSSSWRGLQMPEEIFYRSYDSLYMQGFLYRPPQVEDGRSCPALVQVHGGGTNSTIKRLALVEQYLASRGYVVYSINYRGGSGFGREYQDLSIEDWLNGQGRDPSGAAALLRRQPYANGDVGIYGGSYGGMMSMAAIIRTPEAFDAAVPTRGIYAAEPTWDQLDRVGKLFTATGHGGVPEEKPAVYEESNMVSKMERIQAPLLIMHGEADPRAPFENYELAVERLRELGKEFEAKSYPGEPHGFRDPDNRIDLFERTRDFFDRHLEPCR